MGRLHAMSSEKELSQIANKMNHVELPSKLNESIQAGMWQAQKERRVTKRRIWSSIAVSLFLLVFFTTVRASPTFANYISELPGGKWLVELVHSDKGLQQAIEQNYATAVGVSDEHAGLKLTIEGYTADEARIVIFYSLENKEGYSYASMQHFTLMPNEFLASMSYGEPHFEIENEKMVYGKIDIGINDINKLPEELTLATTFTLELPTTGEVNNEDVWEVIIPFEKESFLGLKEEYSFNETVDFAGQNITFSDAVIYPTQMSIEFEEDKENSLKILSLEELAIENEKGERWEATTNGVISHNHNEWEKTLFLESSYFSEAEELYITASRVRALPKEALQVTFDVNSQTLLTAPRGLTLHEYSEDTSYHHFTFLIKMDEELDQSQSFQIFDRIILDEKKQQLDLINEWSSRTLEDSFEEFSFKVKKGNEQKLVFTIIDYPNRIYDEMKIRIK